MVALNLARLIILHGSVLVARGTYIPKPAEFLSSRYGWVVTNKDCDVDAVHGWLVHVQETLWSLVHPCCACLYELPSDLLVLPTCTPFGVALPSWASPLGLAWLVWVFAPWFPFCGVGLLFAGLFAPLVWSGRLGLPTPWSRLFPLGLWPRCSWRAAVAAAVAAPSLCSVYLGAVQIKVHTPPRTETRFSVKVPSIAPKVITMPSSNPFWQTNKRISKRSDICDQAEEVWDWGLGLQNLEMVCNLFCDIIEYHRHTYVYTHICTHTHALVCICIIINIYIYHIYIHIYTLYMYICTRTHTHTYIGIYLNNMNKKCTYIYVYI